MLFNKSGFHVFNEYDLTATLDSKIKEIQKETEAYIKANSSFDEIEYIKKQIEKHRIKPLKFLPNKLTISTSEQMIPARLFPNSFAVHNGESYKKQVLSFHLPFEGDSTLLRCIPSSRLLWTEEFMLNNNEIMFEMINFNNSTEEITSTKDRIIDSLEKQSSNINNQLIQYNDNLENVIKESISQAKSKVQSEENFINELGIPKKEN